MAKIKMRRALFILLQKNVIFEGFFVQGAGHTRGNGAIRQSENVYNTVVRELLKSGFEIINLESGGEQFYSGSSAFVKVIAKKR
jgi:hypothetical protein